MDVMAWQSPKGAASDRLMRLEEIYAQAVAYYEGDRAWTYAVLDRLAKGPANIMEAAEASPDPREALDWLVFADLAVRLDDGRWAATDRGRFYADAASLWMRRSFFCDLPGEGEREARTKVVA